MSSKKRGSLSQREYDKKYGKTSSSKKSSSSSKKSSSGGEKKAKKQVEKYYKEKTGFAKEDAATQAKRLQEDLDNIYKDTGISQTRAIEDYNRNVGNIEANKALDVASINDYVTVTKGRTQEDLDTSLAKESRRYSLEYDKINQDLADRGLTFSERKPEQIEKGNYAQNVAGIQTEANRSFQDIARYEAAKTAETSLKYGQQTEATETSKKRTLEDIINEQQKAITKNTQGGQDVASALKQTLSDYSYQKNDATSTIGNYYDSQKNYLANQKDIIVNIGT